MNENAKIKNEYDTIDEISIQGKKIANKIRIIISVFLIAIVASAAPNNPLIINIVYIITILLFSILSFLNLKYFYIINKYSILMYLFGVFEISIPTIIKLSHAFTSKPFLMLNEGAAMLGYFLFIVLSLFQNNKKLTITVGLTAVIEYALLIVISIVIFKIPVISGSNEWAYIVIDDEIGKLVMLAGFTAISVSVLRNLQYFAFEALTKEKEADLRAQKLEQIFKSTSEINEKLIEISNQQKEVSQNLSTIAQDQAAMSEELSSIHEEQTSSIELINNNTNNQTEQTKKMVDTINLLIESQKNVMDVNDQMLDNVVKIGEYSKDAEVSIDSMSKLLNIISEGGKTISSFIEVIHDITDQINLLSLNASIEAARAGEYGRGFAVVADEIGKLAGVTSDNAKEISSELSKIIEDIKNSSEIIQKTQESVKTMIQLAENSQYNVDKVHKAIEEQSIEIEEVKNQSELLNSLAEEILVSLNEQQTSMSESNTSVQKLSDMAQNIASKTQDIFHLSDEIFNIAGKLKELMEK